MRINSPTGASAAVVILGLLAGCASVTDHYDAAAATQGLRRGEVIGKGFRHAVFTKPGTETGNILHIYLEGDGSPLLRGSVPTKDPTPRRPMMPYLMALDPGPAVLLGRPCYHGLGHRPPCRAKYWTAARFGPAVVDSLVAAASRLITAGEYQQAVLIGHSGGGVLALLMAASLPRVRAVVALATVADIHLWSRYHGLAPLSGSLNPNGRESMQDPVPELFLAGGRDQVTPLALIEQALAKRPQARLWRFQNFDHVCCWRQVWPEVLAWSRRPL